MSIFDTIRINKISGFTVMFNKEKDIKTKSMCFTSPDLSDS